MDSYVTSVGQLALVLIIGAQTIYKLVAFIIRKANGNGSPLEEVRDEVQTQAIKIAVLKVGLENVEKTCDRIESKLDDLVKSR